MATASRKSPAAAKRKAAPRKAATARSRRPAAKSAPAPKTSATGIAALGTLALAGLGAAAFGAWRLLRRPSEGTVPTDLMGDTHPDGSERAPEAFRPDPTAPVPAAERDQFRPALAS